MLTLPCGIFRASRLREIAALLLNCRRRQHERHERTRASGGSDGLDRFELVNQEVPILQLMAYYKYDHYQQFSPGKRFIESLALWLDQFDREDRSTALNLVKQQLIFISEQEMLHLVQLAYPDVIVQDRLRMVAEEAGIPPYKVGETRAHPRFELLRVKSLYLGLSDGAHTNDLRRASRGEISNEQIWQAYELGEAKADDMLTELRNTLKNSGLTLTRDANKERFSIVWLVDDFSGSGNTYIRFDAKTSKFKGKIKKIYDRILTGDLVDPDYYEVNLLLYVSTRQAIDHIEYWTEQYASEHGLRPLRLHVLHIIEKDVAITTASNPELVSVLGKPKYYDTRASDRHIAIGGTNTARFGFANCRLPLVLSIIHPTIRSMRSRGPEEFGFSGSVSARKPPSR